MVYNSVFIMKMTLYYMTRVTQGARQRHFILWLGVSSGRRESETLGSL